MRTKALLCLAALAVSAATAVAQSNVYSVNIVGYVNVDVKAGMNLLSVPLKPSTGTTQITNTIVLDDTMDSAQIFKWAGTGWATTTPSWIAGEGWDASVDIPLGEAFFLKAPVNGKITFVGEVLTGTLSYSFNPGMNFVANKAPVDEAFPGKTVGNDSDIIFTWGNGAWNQVTWTFIAGEGWSASDPLVVSENGPVVKAGNGIAYNNTGAKIDWTRLFDPK